MASDPTAREGLRDPVRFRFGDIEVDVAAHTLTRAGEPQALEPKAFAVLLELLRHAGELVGRDRLLDAVWGHRHVTPGVLTRAIAQLRTALDDDPHHPRWIRTQHALGYRFVGTLEQDAAAEDPIQPPPDASPSATAVRPARSGERRQTDHPRRRLRFLLALLVVLGMAWAAWPRVAPTPLPADPSIAVLPFTSLGDDPDDRWFAEGLALEMLGALSAVDGLEVVAWRSGEALDRRLDIRNLGRTLGVATVLDATVRRDGPRVRISARLTDTASGHTIWSQSYDRDISAVFDTQGEIATEVAKAIVGVLPDAGEGLRRRLTPTRNVAAFDAYLRGLQAMVGPARAEDAALGHFRAALAKDPGFALAQAGICRIELWRFQAQRAADAFSSARLACLRAANLDPTIGAVQLALGDLYRLQGEADKALQHYQLAESDRTIRADALAGQAAVHAAAGKPELSIEAFRQALVIAPDDPQIHAALAYQQALAERFPESAASFRQAISLDPDNAYLWSSLGGVLMAAGRNDEAEVALERSRSIEPIDAVLANLGTLRYQAGDYGAAAGFYRQAIDLNPATNPSNWGSLADALRADPATAAQAPPVYREAADRAQAYVDINTDDAKALAMLGWFRANLGEAGAARELVRRSEALGRQAGEVAIYNAQTFVALGEPEQARLRIAAARGAGAAESRLATNMVLRRAGLVSPGPAGEAPADPTPPRRGG